MDPTKASQIRGILISALDSYNELNVSTVEELSEDPSPLEFMRFLARNRPFVVRRGASTWRAVRTWDAARLLAIMDESPVKVAVTPFGNADAILTTAEWGSIFVEPLEEEERFEAVLTYIIGHSRGDIPGPVKYCQTQNDNLRDEYARLFAEVPATIPFARIALQQEPDAVNFWLGSSASTTALHRDNYENIYVQVRGQKHFILLPPVAGPAMMEVAVPRARYQKVTGAEGIDGRETSPYGLTAVLQDQEPLPVPTWDPLTDTHPPNIYGKHIKPVHVTLEEGDVMYLPAMWYHHVQQTNGAEGFNCSINYWYDMDFSGSFWTTNAMLKDLAALAGATSHATDVVTS